MKTTKPKNPHAAQPVLSSEQRASHVDSMNGLNGQEQTPPSQDDGKGKDGDKSPEEETAEKSAVSSLTSQIRKWKAKWSEDFKRMRENMNFVAGIQWPGQKKVQDVRYTCNITNRIVQAKTAQLYAKNPTAEWQRRPRMEYQLFDGKLESLLPIVQAGSMVGMQNLPLQAQAVLADFAHGQQQKNLIDKVGKTLEILFQRSMDEVDEDNGDFLTSAKQCVRQAVITGVGYCMPTFVRDSDTTIISQGLADTIANRSARAQKALEKLSSGELDETKPGYSGLRSLLLSLAADVAGNIQSPDVNERIVFDWLPSTSVIPDTKCRNLKHFVGAKKLAIEYSLDIDDVKAIFDVDKDFTPQKSTDRMAGEKETNWISKPGPVGQTEKAKTCTVWHVLDKATGTHCYVCDGYDKYLQEPEVIAPMVRGFWPISVLTFNDVVVEPGCDASIFPPSDVQLIRDTQREWNRSRNQLRKHRKANSPKWMVPKGTLTSGDKDALMSSDTNAVVEVEGILPGTKVGDVIQPVPQLPVEPLVYDSGTMQQDLSMSIGNIAGMTQAPRGKKSATATAATLEAQEDMSVNQSNVEDVDAFLTDIARMSGELWMLEGSPDVVKRVVGPGAVFPTLPTTREDFINQIFLRTKAASSGRPNQAVEVRNWQILGPMLLQMGANPQGLVRETVRRLGDNLDPEQFFPLQPMQPNNQVAAGGQHQPSEQQEHEPGRTQPPQQGRPGPGSSPSSQQQQAQSTPQRQAMVQRN